MSIVEEDWVIASKDQSGRRAFACVSSIGVIWTGSLWFASWLTRARAEEVAADIAKTSDRKPMLGRAQWVEIRGALPSEPRHSTCARCGYGFSDAETRDEGGETVCRDRDRCMRLRTTPKQEAEPATRAVVKGKIDLDQYVGWGEYKR